VVVRNGSIVALGPLDARFDSAREVVLGPDEVLLAGNVDTHVHVNDPGRTEWEGFATATRAAAAGGVTTLVDMPLNSIPPTSASSRRTRSSPSTLRHCTTATLSPRTKDENSAASSARRGCPGHRSPRGRSWSIPRRTATS
jgi:dihydroorotase-like cyclic amidohydrolase